MVGDPISNFLISIKNASLVGKPNISVPYSAIKFEIAQILSKKGFVGAVSKKGKKNKFIEIDIAYDKEGPRVRDVRRISKSSRRLYTKSKDIHVFKSGYGMTVLSTPRGIMSDMDAKKEKVGGEVLFSIW